MKIIPKKSKMKLEIFAGLTALDLSLITAYIGFLVLVLLANVHIAIKIIISIVTIIFGGVSFAKISEQKGYRYIASGLQHLFSQKQYSLGAENVNHDVNVFCPFLKIENDCIHYVSGDIAFVCEIAASNFHFCEENEQEHIIESFGEALKLFPRHSFVKLERELSVDVQIQNLAKEHKRLGSEKALSGTDTSRKFVLQKTLEYFEELAKNKALTKDVFFFVGYADARAIDELAARFIYEIESLQMHAQRLDDMQLSAFIKNAYGGSGEMKECQAAIGTEERAYELVDVALPSSIAFETSKVVIDSEKHSVFQITDYPVQVGNGWAYSLFSLPNTKVFLHSASIAPDKARNIVDKSIIELKRRVAESEREKESVQNFLSEQLVSLQILLESITMGNEMLHETKIFIVAQAETEKEIYNQIRRCGFRLTHLPFRMKKGLLGALPYNGGQLREYAREINTNSYAAFYPFLANELMDDNGIYLGCDEAGYPIFFDIDYHFNRNDKAVQSAATKRTNGNLFNIGAPGGGKSYFNKTAMMEWMAKGDTIICIDPEAEYLKQAMLFDGDIIDVGGGKNEERINPLQVFPPLEDEQEDVTTKQTLADLEDIHKAVGTSYDKKKFKYSFGSYDQSPLTTHRMFLSQFFKISVPNIDEDCELKLSAILGELYENFKISDKTDFAKIANDKYPVMNDLYALIEKKLAKEQSEYDLSLLRRLANYLQPFTSKGMYGKLWSGHTTLSLTSDFIDFNFRGLLSNKNNTVANAQMLLVLRFLENLIIKNRERVKASGEMKHIRIVIDEAHLFIDERSPEALNFMYGMAKRIRKYYGSIIITTQNFKDFLGRTGELNAKASAVINACQYKCIFPLAADDINALETLYQNSAPLTDAESQTVRSLQRGQMLFVVTDKKRMQVSVSILGGQEPFVAAI